MHLLLIEDDPNISQALSHALAPAYQLDRANSGAQALAKAGSCKYDLIILDLHLPDMPGSDVCQRLRAQGLSCPVLVLSAETKIMTKITLLDIGADDYLTKPFSLGELKARIRVLIRRASFTARPGRPLQIGDLSLDQSKHQATRGGTALKLRRKEFALLEYLMQHAGAVVTREALRLHAWRKHENPCTNTIDVHIKHLRDKVDRPFAGQLIKTVHGLGYRLESPVAPDLPQPLVEAIS